MTDLEIAGRENVADWIEQTLLARGSVQIGLDALFKFAIAEIGQHEAAVTLALNAMERRAQALGDAYPFQVFQYAVRALPNAKLNPYSLLLLMTPQSPSRQLIREGIEPMAIAFERLVVVALESLLGSTARAVRFGWPGDQGRPPEFYGAIEWLAAKMGIPAGQAYRPPRRKDGGVDVVGWRPFPDGRSGFPVMLVQCTLQQDVTQKAADIDVRNWAGWLKLDADPTTALAVPGTIPTGETWDKISVRSLILERIRLAGLLSGKTLAEFPGCTELLDAQVTQLIDLLAGAEF
ncbi:MAG: hypothetical protein EXR68_00175 [Dehalococcoidia bacterium]|nr:hypothetical protein [Dehalococcoidia bacterium]